MELITSTVTLWPLPLELGERIYTLIIFVVFTVAVGLGISVFLLVAGVIVKLTEDEMRHSVPPARESHRYRVRG